MQPFTEILTEKMKSTGHSAETLSALTGIHMSTLYDWKRGKSTPNLLHAIELADVFNCSLDELVGRRVRTL